MSGCVAADWRQAVERSPWPTFGGRWGSSFPYFLFFECLAIFVDIQSFVSSIGALAFAKWCMGDEGWLERGIKTKKRVTKR